MATEKIIAPARFWSTLDWSSWVYGLLAGGIGGGATAIYGAFAASMVDSNDFGLGSTKSWELMGAMFAMSFVKDAALYLKQNPMPHIKTITTTTETVEHQKSPAVTVTKKVEEVEVQPIPAAPKEGS